MFADADSDLFLSVASLWEIAIKSELGKLALPGDTLEEYLLPQIGLNRVRLLSVEPSHAPASLARLARHHRDPFDRLLVSQCLVEGVPPLTKDSSLAAYGIETLW